MRFLVTILMFFTLMSVSAQEVELVGRYSASFIGAESIEFVGKDSFYFGGFYCTYSVEGKGRCEIRNNYLYLYFEKKVEDTSKPVRQPEITKLGKADSLVTIIVTCLDEVGEPIPFMTVHLKRNKMSTIGTVGDELGVAHFRIPKSNLSFAIDTDNGEHETTLVSTVGDSDCNIKIYHRLLPSIREINKGQVYTYEINELTEEMISMRPSYSKGSYWQYKKKYPKE